MRLQQGVQTELLLSLVLVMVTGTGLLAGILLQINQARIADLHGILGRGLVSAVADPSFESAPGEGGSWWRLDPQGEIKGLNASAHEVDPETLALARESLASHAPLVQSGAPWAPIRFAAPRPHTVGVVFGRINAPVSPSLLIALMVTDLLIFGLFGVSLIRRRVVSPLHKLAAAVRGIGEGEAPGRVPEEGASEIEELGTAFNEMQDRLFARTTALEKAVIDLRTANTSLVQAREGLGRAERMAMVGNLAAGVAHEVGNPMGALLAFLDLAGRDEGLGDEGRRCLTRATEQGERVRVILRQLLDFSRPPQVEHVALPLEAAARQVIELVSAQREYSDIEFEIDVEPGTPEALGDASLTSQILLNLVLNAASALEGASERRIHIHVEPRRSRLRASDTTGDESATRPPDAVVCFVADSGPGIAAAHVDRIFDPFFTTKAPGLGTGLGLANARRLAEEMAGEVAVEPGGSDLGGAVFWLSLPVAGESLQTEDKPADAVTVRSQA